MVALEVLSPKALKGSTMDRGNATALEQGMAKLGLEVRRKGQVVTQGTGTTGTDMCSPLIDLRTPAPTGNHRKPVKRALKIRADAADKRKDMDVLLLGCDR
jgi:hypothetical protein